MAYTFPKELYYAKTHEWVRREGEVWACGVSDVAQDLLSDVVFIDLPKVGDHFQQGEVCATVESVKSAEDVYMPLSGTITAVNEALTDAPEAVNADPYGAWFFRFRADNADAELKNLMDAAVYEPYAIEEARKSGH